MSCVPQCLFFLGCALVLLGQRMPVMGLIGVGLMVAGALLIAWQWTGERRDHGN